VTDYSKIAMDYFKQGYNCSQSVVATFYKEMNMDFDTAMKISLSFGGGMGRLREVCGAVSGMFMVVGAIYGYNDPNDRKAKALHYKLIQDLGNKFKDQNGSIICRELLGLGKGASTPTPDERTAEYYKKRPCVELVGMAAGLVGDLINSKKTEVSENENCNSL
jgi:C_GCAxxG_C_C family probable redox protein